MSTSTIEALASAWARIAEEAEFPADYEGTATPQAHRASEAIQEQIRERIVATNDMRLFSLLHLLGQASLRMEQALWPEDYERMTREVEEALRQATDANARSYTHEEVMQAMQERIDRARDKPSGRFFFHVMASLAEMERELTVERTRAGLEVAKQLGRKGGRKPKMTDSKIESAKKLLASGVPPKDVAKNLGVSIPTLYRWVPASTHA